MMGDTGPFSSPPLQTPKSIPSRLPTRHAKSKPPSGYIGSRVRTAYAHDNGTVVLDVLERKVASEPVSLVFVRPLKVCTVGC